MMTDYNFILVYEGVDPAIDLDAIHGAYLAAGMDVSTLCGRLDAGYLALDVTTYEGDAMDGLTSALGVARQVLGSARLQEVAPDLVDRRELSIRTGIAVPNLQRYINQPWFPHPVANGKFYRLDEAVQALRQHTRAEIDDVESLTEAARAARFINAELAIRNLSCIDVRFLQHRAQAAAALAL